MEKVGIIGMGLIGRAWAIVFARAGFQVAVWDGVAGAAKRGLAAIDVSVADLEAAGLIHEPHSVVRARISEAATLQEAAADTVYIQENVTETLNDKRTVFSALDAAAPPTAVLASSTSAIQCSHFTEHLAGRARCLVAHPVNPPYLIPVVELSGAPWTSAVTIARARDFQERAGQVPVTVLKEIDGFILNRLQSALLNEAFRLIEGGYVSPEDLDRTVKDGLGLRWSFMGPVETADLNAPAGIADYLKRYSGIFRGVDTSIRATAPWSDSVIPTVDAARRNTAPTDKIAAHQAWRDRKLMALLAHKAAQAKLPKP